jgi:very-short-patch-repair endonuclease
MSFQVEHEKWLNDHLKQRKGERLDALKRGHGYGNQLFVERIWWSIIGHFHGLHPEYEVKDWRGRSYFVDFMWMVGAIRIVFEIMDYGSHGTDRSKYRRDLNRGLFLQAQDCMVYSISLDEMKENPSFILSAVQNILAPYLAAVNGKTGAIERKYSKIERDLMRAAIRNNRVIRPTKAARELELHKMTVIKHCRKLVEKGKFRAVSRGKSERIIYYEYIGTIQNPDLV